MEKTIIIDGVSFPLKSDQISIGDLLKLAGKEGSNEFLKSTYELFRVFESGGEKQEDLLFGGNKNTNISDKIPVEDGTEFIIKVSDDAPMQASFRK